MLLMYLMLIIVPITYQTAVVAAAPLPHTPGATPTSTPFLTAAHAPLTQPSHQHQGQQQCIITPESLTDDHAQQEQLLELCAGRHGVQRGVPYDCQQYVVCCSGVPLSFTCHLPMHDNPTAYLVSVEDVSECCRL
jgi:hypothetical protein